MEAFEMAVLWAMLGVPVLASVLLYVLRSRYNQLIALHLAILWAQFFAYSAIWLSGQRGYYFPPWMMVLLALELTIYCWTLLALPLRRFARLISDAATELPTWALFAAAVTPLSVSLRFSCDMASPP